MSEAETNVATATKAKREVQVETVTMDDGRVVDFSGKKKMQKESTYSDQGVTIRLDFRNGETRTYLVHAKHLSKAACHGVDQKFGDEIAGIDDIDDSILAIDELGQRLVDPEGDWNTKREANGFAGTSILLKAIVELTKGDVAKVRDRLKTKTHAEKMAMRNSEQLKAIIERLEKEKVEKGPKVDTAALLADFA